MHHNSCLLTHSIKCWEWKQHAVGRIRAHIHIGVSMYTYCRLNSFFQLAAVWSPRIDERPQSAIHCPSSLSNKPANLAQYVWRDLIVFPDACIYAYCPSFICISYNTSFPALWPAAGGPSRLHPCLLRHPEGRGSPLGCFAVSVCVCVVAWVSVFIVVFVYRPSLSLRRGNCLLSCSCC